MSQSSAPKNLAEGGDGLETSKDLYAAHNPNGNLVKSKQRISDHGEVFTPSWLVEDMLSLVSHETSRIDSRFLEPACGSGNFLGAVLLRKFESVDKKYSKSDFERKIYALFSLMCIYGIELLADNIEECQSNLLEIFCTYLNLGIGDKIARSAREVLKANIIQGDALTLLNVTGKPIEFPEWGYLGKGKFQRRNFRYDVLTQRAGIEGTLFEMFEEHQLFRPTRVYPPIDFDEITS